MKISKTTKAVMLGLSNSGKSTVAEILFRRGWPVFEVDDEAFRRNSNIWNENEVVMDKLFKEINEEVLKYENVVYVTSFLEATDIIRFVEAGFKIIELHTDYKELIRRKTIRDTMTKETLERYDKNYKNYFEIVRKSEQYFSLSLDTKGSDPVKMVDQIEEELIK